MFNLFRLCRKDEISFDIVAETGNIVAKNGNNVEATFDIVDRIVQLVAFDNVAWTLLLVWFQHTARIFSSRMDGPCSRVYTGIFFTIRQHGCRRGRHFGHSCR